MAQLVELDSRRRVSLARIARHDHYLVEVKDDGTMIFTPAVVMTASEAQLLKSPELVERVKGDLAELARMKRRKLESPEQEAGH